MLSTRNPPMMQKVVVTRRPPISLDCVTSSNYVYSFRIFLSPFNSQHLKKCWRDHYYFVGKLCGKKKNYDIRQRWLARILYMCSVKMRTIGQQKRARAIFEEMHNLTSGFWAVESTQFFRYLQIPWDHKICLFFLHRCFRFSIVSFETLDC